MFSKNQSAHSPGSPLINLGANSCKLINHGTNEQTTGYSEIHFYFEIHSEMAEIHVSGFSR